MMPVPAVRRRIMGVRMAGTGQVGRLAAAPPPTAVASMCPARTGAPRGRIDSSGTAAEVVDAGARVGGASGGQRWASAAGPGGNSGRSNWSLMRRRTVVSIAMSFFDAPRWVTSEMSVTT